MHSTFEILEAVGESGRTITINGDFFCKGLSPKKARSLVTLLKTCEGISWVAVDGCNCDMCRAIQEILGERSHE